MGKDILHIKYFCINVAHFLNTDVHTTVFPNLNVFTYKIQCFLVCFKTDR